MSFAEFKNHSEEMRNSWLFEDPPDDEAVKILYKYTVPHVRVIAFPEDDLELVEDFEGNQNSNCVFADGTICSEWAFYRGQCGQEKSYCQTHNGTLERRTTDTADSSWSSSYAVCVFDDGSECLEQNYFDGTCQPGHCVLYDPSQGGCVTK